MKELKLLTKQNGGKTMFEKTKDFCKKHKKEIIVAGGVIITVGACCKTAAALL